MTKVIGLVLVAAAVAAAQEHSYTQADTENGARLYQSSCARCRGPGLAPDLSEIGTIRPAAELQQKLLDPNAAIRPGNRYIELTMKNGAKMSGRLLNQDTFTIQLLDANKRLVSVSRSDVRDLVF